jgi:hypothetical protein
MRVERASKVVQCVQDVAVMKFKSEVLVLGLGGYKNVRDGRLSCRNYSE